MMSDPSAALAAVRLLLASLAVAVLPGVAIVLAWRPRRDITVLDLTALALAMSFIVAQALTVAAIVLHQPIGIMLAVLGVVALAHAVAAGARRQVSVRFPRSESILAGAFALVAACLYVAGSPYGSTEDAIHIAIVRRLRFLDTPSLHNIYPVPNVVYTYPFPGTHYVMAAISRVADLDPLFVYHKLRAFWGCAALILLYACARCVFESRPMALASALVATVLVANGSFAGVPNFYWGQLAPYSHASDVAMGVLLPSLLLLVLQVFRAQTSRETTFYTVGVAGLIVMLTMVHIREALQCAMYLAAFLVALLIVKRERRLLARTVGLLVLALAIPLLYNAWHQSIALDVDRLVQDNRRTLFHLAEEMSIRDWLRHGVDVLSGFIPAFNMFFYGWNPIVLLGAAVLVVHRRVHAVVLLIAASVLAFAIVLRVAPVTWAYLYATYFEALYTPVRNVIFFEHLATGGLVYVAAERMARLTSLFARVGMLVATAIVIALAYTYLGPLMAGYHDLLWLPLMLGYATAAWWMHRTATTPLEVTASEPERLRATTALAVVLTGCAAFISWSPSSSPIVALFEPTMATPAALFAATGCRQDDSYTAGSTAPGMKPIEITGVLSCPPPVPLIRFAESELSVHSVLAVDRYDEYSPAMFMPQQMNIWPGEGDGLLDQRELFAPYFRFYDAALRRYREQPFFNAQETADERAAFIEGLGITHVLVNPRSYSMMTTVLGGLPDTYRRRYDDGRWAIYEVRR